MNGNQAYDRANDWACHRQERYERRREIASRPDPELPPGGWPYRVAFWRSVGDTPKYQQFIKQSEAVRRLSELRAYGFYGRTEYWHYGEQRWIG